LNQNYLDRKTGAIIIEGHVQGLSNTRSLGEAGIPVFVVDNKDCIAKYSKYCTKYFRCPDYDKDDLAWFLIDLAKKEDIRSWVLLPSNDHAVYTVSRNKSKLEEYYNIITPGLEVIDIIYNKAKLIDIARDFKIPVPTTYKMKSYDDEDLDRIKFPVILKGCFGLSFYKAIRKKGLLANTRHDLKVHLKKISESYDVNKVLIQELIDSGYNNKVISFTAFSIKGEIKTSWTGEKIREHPHMFGTATFAGSTTCLPCYNQSAELLNALDFTGVCEIEYIWDYHSKEYKLIEINPRTWLWVGLAKAEGVDYARIIYDYANGKLKSYPERTGPQRYWINPVTDFVFSLLSILKLRLNPVDYFKSILVKGKVNALFAKNDFMPAWIYILKVFRFLNER